MEMKARTPPSSGNLTIVWNTGVRPIDQFDGETLTKEDTHPKTTVASTYQPGHVTARLTGQQI
jgi:hypothetical protein